MTSMSSNLKDVLLDAAEQNRLTCGIYECGKLLEMNPDGIMLVLLPESTKEDVALHIHLTLIEAFCWENDIRVLKVDSLAKVASLLPNKENEPSESDTESIDRSSTNAGSATDYNCVLIEYPSGKCSPAEEKLLDFHAFTFEMVPQPAIPLEV
jgi:growth arrest and DNA-damage-inducible protein